MANGQQSTNNNTKDTRASDGKGKDKDSAAKAPANHQTNGSARAPAKPDSGAAKK